MPTVRAAGPLPNSKTTAKQQQNSRVFDAGVTCNLLFIVAGKGLFISPKSVQKEFIIVVWGRQKEGNSHILLADRKRGFLTFF